MNGMGGGGNYGGYHPMNGYEHQMQFQPEQKPQIYTAVYSSVSVYEMEVNGVAVMRRRSDGWLNATQILKVAGMEKGKRTKVLEKEVLTGEHEKVQGGYGKYQGTWINYRRGVEFCRQYLVYDILRPLLEYDIDQDGMAGQQGHMETPTKEQAMAALRKRQYNGQDNRPSSRTSNGTFFRNISSQAANAVNTLNKTRIDSPVPRGMEGRRSVGPRRPSHNYQGSQEVGFQSASQHSMHSMASDSSFGGPVQNANPYPYASDFADFPDSGDLNEPPRKRLKQSQSDSFMGPVDPGLQDSIAMGSPTEPNASFFSQAQDGVFDIENNALSGLPPLPLSGTPAEDRKKELLVDLFMDPNRSDFSDHPAFLQLSGDDFEIPIDTSSNTALHWAATLARIPLVRQLLAKGFDPRRTNSGGETALISACGSRNNHDQNSFAELLEVLGPTIEIRDGRGRTLLHHIAVSSAIRARGGVARYYLESLLAFVVQKGGQQSSQSSSGITNGASQPCMNITLGRFMSELVNAQDKAGDTALNLAARTSTKGIIHQLIEVGANPAIKNNGGLAPVDFGVGDDMGQPSEQTLRSSGIATNGNVSTQTSFAETQTEIITSIRDLFAASELDFNQEATEKKAILDEVTAKLKEAGSALNDEKRHLAELKKRTSERADLDNKLSNLTRSSHDLREKLSQSNPSKPVIDHIAIGEADKGLDLDGALAHVEQLFPNGLNQDIPFSDEQAALLASLERMEVLSGRNKAYRQHNAVLEMKEKELKWMSTDLEERYRKIVSLCTGVDEAKVDEMLGSLVQAVMSEQKESMDISRIREFMRMVEGAES